MDQSHGIITFLLTDIVGSTALWERYPDAMRLALVRHDSLAGEIIAAHGGMLVKPRGQGDSLFTVFPRATDALSAACTLQRAYLQESWQRYGWQADPSIEDDFALRVRMALHTGEADLRDGDYYGATVNRCARLRDVGHGGQILLSQAVYELAHAALPTDACLQELGSHRLRDLQQSEHVWQLCHPELPSEFEPLRSLNALRHNLPVQVTSFIGREDEIAEVKRLLNTTRLLTLTGSGGVGKTRLALQVAAELLDRYPDGVWLAEMAPLSDPALVQQAVAAVLNVREEPGRNLTQTLIDHLQSRRLLLLLDNCEHLLPACAGLIEAILRGCADVQILASSREGLNIAGETLYRLPSLTLPARREPVTASSARQYEALGLFLDRAAAASPSFTATDRNAPVIAQLCCHLDGIPLAIELAATRVKSLPVEQIAERLADRFRLLTGGSRTALPRQQTLRALIDWSYELLATPERELFHRLSVFVGGFTLEAGEAVSKEAEEEEEETLDLLTALVDKSLLILEEQDGRARYRMLETLRQYAREKLALSGQEEAAQQRHLAYFLGMAEEAERKLRGSEQAWWLERLDTEHDNLRAALAYGPTTGSGTEEAGREDVSACVRHPNVLHPEAGLRLAGALWWFWHVRGHFTEGREWLALKLAASSSRTADRAKALNGAGVLARNQGDYAAARMLSLQSLEIKRELGDRQGIAASLNNLATLALSQGDYATARPHYEESLAIERQLGNRQGITSSLMGLGNVALEQGDYAAARTLYTECLRIKRELGDKRGIATSLAGQGSAALAQGHTLAARTLHEEALSLRRHLGERRGIAVSLQSLGAVATAEGNYAAARVLYAESLAIRQELGDKLGIANTLCGQGYVAWREGDAEGADTLCAASLEVYRSLENRRGIAAALYALAFSAAQQRRHERAARLLGAADSLRQRLGFALQTHERADFARCIAATRKALGTENYAAIHAAGREAGADADLLGD
jgi:predicted ATPase/class 3 adenylate cyclase